MYTFNTSKDQTGLAVVLVTLVNLFFVVLPDVGIMAMVLFLLLSFQTQTDLRVPTPRIDIINHGYRVRQLTFMIAYGNLQQDSVRHLDIAVPFIIHLRLKIDGSSSHLFDFLGLTDDYCVTGFSLGKVISFSFLKKQLQPNMGLFWNLDLMILLKRAYRQQTKITKDVALLELNVNHHSFELDITHQEIETVVGLYKRKEQVTQVLVLNQPTLNFTLTGSRNLAQSIIALKAQLAHQ